MVDVTNEEDMEMAGYWRQRIINSVAKNSNAARSLKVLGICDLGHNHTNIIGTLKVNQAHYLVMSQIDIN